MPIGRATPNMNTSATIWRICSQRQIWSSPGREPNSICELLALRKPNILIPLSARASRGDQILNARSFERQGFSYVIEEETLTPEVLFNAIQTVNENRASYIQAMEQSGQKDAVAAIMKLIEEIA